MIIKSYHCIHNHPDRIVFIFIHASGEKSSSLFDTFSSIHLLLLFVPSAGSIILNSTFSREILAKTSSCSYLIIIRVIESWYFSKKMRAHFHPRMKERKYASSEYEFPFNLSMHNILLSPYILFFQAKYVFENIFFKYKF